MIIGTELTRPRDAAFGDLGVVPGSAVYILHSLLFHMISRTLTFRIYTTHLMYKEIKQTDVVSGTGVCLYLAQMPLSSDVKRNSKVGRSFGDQTDVRHKIYQDAVGKS
jgi:hypothetical protein